MRVVLDANVIIAAFIGKGLFLSVFQICLVRSVCEDKSDIPIVGTAVSGNADF